MPAVLTPRYARIRPGSQGTNRTHSVAKLRQPVMGTHDAVVAG